MSDLDNSQLMDLPHGGSVIVDPDGYAALLNQQDQAPAYRNHPSDPTDSANDYLDWKHHRLPHQRDVQDYKQFLADNPMVHSTGGAPNYDGTPGAAAAAALPGVQGSSWSDRARTAMEMARLSPQQTFGPMQAALASKPYAFADHDNAYDENGVGKISITRPDPNAPPEDTLPPGWLDRYMSTRTHAPGQAHAMLNASVGDFDTPVGVETAHRGGGGGPVKPEVPVELPQQTRNEEAFKAALQHLAPGFFKPEDFESTDWYKKALAEARAKDVAEWQKANAQQVAAWRAAHSVSSDENQKTDIKKEDDAKSDLATSAADAVSTVGAPKSYTDAMADALNAEPDLLKKYPSTATNVMHEALRDEVVHHGNVDYDLDAPRDDASQYRNVPYEKAKDTGSKLRDNTEDIRGKNKGITPLYKSEDRFPYVQNERKLEKLDAGNGDDTYEGRTAAALKSAMGTRTDEAELNKEIKKDADAAVGHSATPYSIKRDKYGVIESIEGGEPIGQPAAGNQIAAQAYNTGRGMAGDQSTPPLPPPEHHYELPTVEGSEIKDDGADKGLVVSQGAGATTPEDTQAGIGPHAINVPAQDLPKTAPFRIDDIIRHTLEQGGPIREEANALSGQSRAEANLWRRIGETEQKNAQEGMAQEQARREKVDNLMQDLRNQADAIATQKIDPTHFWTSKDNGAKAMTVLALMFGGMLQGMHGGENPAMKMVNDAIDRDIAVQKANMAHRKEKLDTTKSQLELMRLQFGDERSAEAATKLSRINSLKAFIEGEKAKYADPVFQARADAAIAQLNIRADQLGIDLHQYVPAHQAMVGGFGQADPEKYVPSIGAVFFRKSDAEDTVNELHAYEDAQSHLQAIQGLRARHGELSMEERVQLHRLEGQLQQDIQGIANFKRLSKTDEEVNKNIVGNADAIINGTGTDENIKALRRDFVRQQISRIQARGGVGATHAMDPMSGQVKVYYNGKGMRVPSAMSAPTNTGYQSLSQ